LKRVSWTSQAFADLESIYAFFARDSEHYARRIYMQITVAVDRLEMFPLSGRVVPEYARKDVREVIHSPYRIVYRVLEQEVHILTVTHAARPLPDDLPG
jgi:toxin ParE1/3/4